MRRLLAALGAATAVAVVLTGTALPAHAAAPVIEFGTPKDEQRFGESAFDFDATVRMDNGGTVRGYAVAWSSADNRPVPERTQVSGISTPSHRIELANRAFPWNGRYRVDVTATGHDGTFDANGNEDRTESADFVVDAAPAPPNGLITSVDGDRKVTVSWQPNGEPDMAGYEVQRQLGSAPWQHVTVTGTNTTSVLDGETAEAGGTYRYRVVAFRASGDAGKLNPSLPSNTHTAKVPAPPATTTTTTSTTTPGDDDEEEKEKAPTGGTGNRSGTSTGTGSTGGSRTGSGSTGKSGGSTAGATATTLPTSGKVDLTGFASLLEQARQSGRSPSPALAGEEVDGGFGEALPFGGRTRNDSDDDVDSVGDGDDVALFDEGIADDGGDRLRSLAFLAGGLLATVLVMHLLWVRSEVRRADALEAVAPEPPPVRPPRRRRFMPEADAAAPEDEPEPAAVG